MTYATLAQAERALQGQVADADAVRIYEFLMQVTDRIDSQLFLDRIGFEPVQRTIQFTITRQITDADTGRLQLPKPLLAYDSMTINGTAIAAAQAGVLGFGTPYKALWLSDDSIDCGYTWQNISCPGGVGELRRLRARVTGQWGYHSYYTDAWQDSGDSVQDGAGINATVTTITVTDADGADWRGLTPRFSAGQLIRIGTEYIRIDDTDTAAETLTVRRGVNGTTMAAHANAAQIDTYYPDERVVRITARQAGLLYARRGGYDVKASDAMGGETVFPQDQLIELQRVLQDYQYR